MTNSILIESTRAYLLDAAGKPRRLLQDATHEEAQAALVLAEAAVATLHERAEAPTGEPPADIVLAERAAKLVTETGIELAEAMHQVAREDPALGERYLAESVEDE